METIDTTNFCQLWWRGVIRPGDVMLFDYSDCGGINLIHRVIRSVQRRLLRDLGAKEYPGIDESRYSHAGVAGARCTILEMTTPMARARAARLMVPGTRVMVRRPRYMGEDIAEAVGLKIVDVAWRDVAQGRRYPYSELLVYWLWSWSLNKLFFGRHFANVFRSDRADVCSGSVWRWMLEAGLNRGASVSDLRPEAWYPARLAVEENRFRTVGVWRIDERTADAGPATLHMEHNRA